MELFLLPEVKVHTETRFLDSRGALWTTWNQKYSHLTFNHDKVSVSNKNVLRGLHCDSKSWKLITCLQGKIQLVVVDFRKDSPNYLNHMSMILSEEEPTTVLIPPMFANGHLVLSDKAIFFYKWSYPGEYPDTDCQYSLNWKDPSIGINWMVEDPILSERDKNSKYL